MVWKLAHIPIPELPNPTEYGWTKTDTGLEPILMTKTGGIPESVINIISCNCKTGCNNNRCGQ